MSVGSCFPNALHIPRDGLDGEEEEQTSNRIASAYEPAHGVLEGSSSGYALRHRHIGHGTRLRELVVGRGNEQVIERVVQRLVVSEVSTEKRHEQGAIAAKGDQHAQVYGDGDGEELTGDHFRQGGQDKTVVHLSKEATQSHHAETVGEIERV